MQLNCTVPTQIIGSSWIASYLAAWLLYLPFPCSTVLPEFFFSLAGVIIIEMLWCEGDLDFCVSTAQCMNPRRQCTSGEGSRDNEGPTSKVHVLASIFFLEQMVETISSRRAGEKYRHDLDDEAPRLYYSHRTVDDVPLCPFLMTAIPCGRLIRALLQREDLTYTLQLQS